MSERLRIMQRQPMRITITISHHLHGVLLDRSDNEGRSMSNLCSYLLEESLRNPVCLPVAWEPIRQDTIGMKIPSPLDRKIRGIGNLRGGCGP